MLTLGSKGSTVRTLQRNLSLRFEAFEMTTVMSVRVDGFFGRETLTAVKYWQCVVGLPVNGRVDEPIWRFITMGVAGLPPLSMGMRRVSVRAVQKTILAAGVPVPVDGNFGSQTVTSVKAYQQAMGIETSGKVDAQTWQEIVRSRLTTLPCVALLPNPYRL
ncbi:MAG: peptidoglycan-binding protein [Phormidesmis sp.]